MPFLQQEQDVVEVLRGFCQTGRGAEYRAVVDEEQAFERGGGSERGDCVVAEFAVAGCVEE